jgi:predicted nucleic acid-binding protein
MNGFLLDTNVLSEFNRRAAPDANVDLWLSSANTNSLSISVITLAEIRFGIERMPNVKGRAALNDG